MFSRQIIQSAILLLALVNCTSKKYIQNFTQEAPGEESRTVEVSTLPAQNQPVIYDGAGSSGGGKGVVCRDASGKINAPVELLEFWEARVISGLSLKETNLSLRDKVMNSLKRISETMLLNPLEPLKAAPRDADELFDVFKLDAGKWLDEQNGNINRLRNVNLLITQDSHEVASPAANCRVEQIVNYLDERGEIFANQDLIDRMSVTNQAALIVHEVLYAYLRRVNEERNSLRTRKYVRMVFFGADAKNTSASHLEGQYYCSERTDFENEESASQNVVLIANKKSGEDARLSPIPIKVFGVKLLDKERFQEDSVYRTFALSDFENKTYRPSVKFQEPIGDTGLDSELNLSATMLLKGSKLWVRMELARDYPQRAPLVQEIPCRPIRFAIP